MKCKTDESRIKLTVIENRKRQKIDSLVNCRDRTTMLFEKNHDRDNIKKCKKKITNIIYEQLQLPN